MFERFHLYYTLPFKAVECQYEGAVNVFQRGLIILIKIKEQ